MQRLCDQLINLEIDCICAAGLFDMMHLPMIQTNHRLLIALAKQWHNDKCSFHLAMGEILVTLEDFWRILHIQITGELVTYDRVMDEAALRRVFPYSELEVYDKSIPLEDITDLYETLPAVLLGIIGGLLCPDQRSHGLSVGWG